MVVTLDVCDSRIVVNRVCDHLICTTSAIAYVFEKIQKFFRGSYNSIKVKVPKIYYA